MKYDPLALIRFNHKSTMIHEQNMKSFKEFIAENKKTMNEIRVEQDLEDHHPRIVHGVKGMKSKPFSKKFKNQAHMEKWMDSDDYGNHTIHSIEKS